MSLSSVIRYVRALDTTSVVGAGKTGLAFGDVTAKYIVEGGTLTSLTTETITTLGTYQAPTSAAHIRIKELSASDPAKGEYEVHFHDTQVAAAGKKLWLFLSASNTLFEVLKVDVVEGALQSTERDSIAAALLDLIDGTESGETVRQTLRLMRAALVGKASGFPLGPGVFRDRADTKNRISATVDASGNRTAITTDAT